MRLGLRVRLVRWSGCASGVSKIESSVSDNENKFRCGYAHSAFVCVPEAFVLLELREQLCVDVRSGLEVAYAAAAGGQDLRGVAYARAGARL